MKKIVLLLLPLLVVSITLTGFSLSDVQGSDKNTNQETTNNNLTSIQTENDEEEGDEEEAEVDLVAGTNAVLKLIDQLKGKVKPSIKDTKDINMLGKELEEKWDTIEDTVEKKYPDDYAKIEKSLYPLIAIAKKDKLDMDKLKQYMKETDDKLAKFKAKLSS
ncbi:hypothetical protein [Aquibacillus saliphilus]|uniref:hypothetical protein n=1 Tax=Aquibacillus saliphilus TaxID=1909422 RepID=UPI001CF05918|nr:hypothetical protein [Aquibacillus saliphilus]